jgi:hypothetical protein
VGTDAIYRARDEWLRDFCDLWFGSVSNQRQQDFARVEEFDGSNSVSVDEDNADAALG